MPPRPSRKATKSPSLEIVEPSCEAPRFIAPGLQMLSDVCVELEEGQNATRNDSSEILLARGVGYPPLMRASLAVALIVLGSSPMVTLAQEQDAGAPAHSAATKEAEARIALGRRMFEAGRFEAALAEFEQAHSLSGDWRHLIFVGTAHTRLQEWTAAVRVFERYLKEGGVDVPEIQRTQVETELRAIDSTVARVTVLVAGKPAAVAINGKRMGTSPLPVELLSPGRYTFRASRNGFEPAEQTVRVVSKQSLTVKLALKPTILPGELRIDSRPVGATLRLNGESIGLAPWNGTLPAGSYTLQASLKGHYSTTREVFVGAGQKRNFVMELREPSIVTKWYFWTGLGIAVTGTTFAILITQLDRNKWEVDYRYP